MNEEALKYSFDLFVKDGYNGTIDDYKELIKTNDKARSVSYNLFTSDGYNGSDADFNNLMGIDNTIMLSDEELGKTNDSANVDPSVESDTTGSGLDDGLSESPNEKNTWLENFFEEKPDAENKLFGYVDFVSDLYRSGKGGWAVGKSVDESFDLFKSEGGMSEEDAVALVESGRNIESYGSTNEQIAASAKMKKLQDEGYSNVGAFLSAYWDNPSALASTMASSLSMMASSFFDSEEVRYSAAAGSGAGAVTGAAGGAGVGAAFGGVGAIPGAIIGAKLGAVSGAMSGITTAMETGLTTAQLLEEQAISTGLDWGNMTDKQRINFVMSLTKDKEQFDELKNKALARGLTIGGVDYIVNMATFGVGKLVSGRIASSAASALTKPITGLAAGTTETVGTGFGEYLGQKAAGQEFNFEEIALEALADKQATVISAIKNIRKGNPSYKLNGEKMNGKRFSEQLKIMDDAAIVSADIEIKNSPGVQKLIDNRRQNISADQKVDSSISGVEDRAEAIRLVKEQAKLKRNKEGNKSKLEKIDAELRAITEKYADSDADVTIQERQEAVAKAVDTKFEENFNKYYKGAKQAAKDLGFKQGPKIYKTTKGYEKAIAAKEGFDSFDKYIADVAKRKNISIEKAAEISRGSDGVFLGEGVMFIDKQKAKEVGAITVASHELLHPVFNAAIGDAKAQGKIVREFKKAMTSKQKRFVRNKLKANVSPADWNTEYLNYFSDAILKGEINYDKTLFEKLKDVVLRVLKGAGFENVSFDSGREVYNFLKEYNTSLKETGQVSEKAIEAIKTAETKRTTKLRKENADAPEVKAATINRAGDIQKSVNQEILDLTEALDAAEDAYAADPNNPTLEKNVELAEKALDEAEERAISGASKPKVVTPKPKKEKKKPKVTTKKKSTAPLKKETAKSKKILDDIGNDPKGYDKNNPKIYEVLSGIIKSKSKAFRTAGGNVVNLATLPQFEMDNMIQETLAFLAPMITKFNPKVNDSLYGYLNSQLSNKMRSALKSGRVTEAEFTEDVTDAKGVAGDAGVIRNFADEKQIAPDKLVKASKVITPKVRADLANMLKKWASQNNIDFNKFRFGDVDANATVKIDGKDVKVLNEVLKELFPGVDPEKFLDSRTMFTSGEAGTVLSKLAENDQELIELFINLLPRGAVMPKGKNKAIVKDANYGKSTKLDGSILKNFYDKGTERFTKKAGLTPFILKDNIRYSDVHKAFGMDSSGNKLNYQRAKSGIVLSSAYKMLGKLIMNEVIRTDLGLTAEQKMNVGAGKSDLQFNRSQLEALKGISVNIDFFKNATSGKRMGAGINLYVELATKGSFEDFKNYLLPVISRNNPSKDEGNTQLFSGREEFFVALVDYQIRNGLQEKYPTIGIQEIESNKKGKETDYVSTFVIDGKLYTYNFGKTSFTTLSGGTVKIAPGGLASTLAQRASSYNYITKEDSGFIANIENRKNFAKDQGNGLFRLVKDLKKKIDNLPEDVERANEIKLEVFAVLQFLIENKDALIRTAAPPKFMALINDKSAKYIYEHSQPASVTLGELSQIVFDSQTKNNKFGKNLNENLREVFDEVMEGFVVSLIPEIYNKIFSSVDLEYAMPREGTSDLQDYSKKVQKLLKDGYPPRYLNEAFINETKKRGLVPLHEILDDITTEDIKLNVYMQTSRNAIETTETLNKANNNANNINAKPKGISVWDFDDTLAKTKSNVLYTMSDGTKGKLNAEEFAKKGDQMLEEGVEFDFSEFSKVVNGSKGPFFEKAMARNKKFGNKNVFILTARPANSASAIHEFLKGIGLDIPLANITGLANSSPQAKADWIVGKAAEGYNDFYFADDAIQNVKAVAKALEVLDVKSKVRQANVQFSKSMNSEFNQMIEKKSGIDARGTISKYKASVMGRKKGRFQFFIPPGAEDFEGLMYKLLDKGEIGEQQKEWFKKALFDPFARGINEFDTYKLQVANAVRQLKKSLKNIPKELGKRDPKTDFKYEDAVRVYLWQLNGHEIKGISESDIKALVDIVKNSPNLKRFARQLNKTMGGYPAPQESWLAGTITTDAINMVNTIKRKEFLETWQQNADIIFSEDNLNKLEATFGEDYVEALKDSLYRMKSGRNRPSGANKLTNKFMNWVNDSVATIMFFNTRSALLQTLSTVNFINWGDNNPLLAAKAFSNQKQFWGDFAMLFNSDFLKSRRTGLKNDVNADEIANAAATQTNKAKAVLAVLLKAGFLPTQMADSFAIAMGGASFYRNRVNTYMQKGEGKPGMGRLAAEEQAFLDFQEIAEATQQSSRPDRVSQQQASPLGRIILAFANTPMQYMRLTKKAFLDLKNGRGSAKENITKMLYYAAIQNVIFSSLQAALFATLFDDEEEEETKKKGTRVANTMLDSMLRGLGIYGAVASTVKNIVLEIDKQSKKDRPDYSEAAVKALDLSPPISSKIRKGRSAGRAFSYKKTREKMVGFGLDNPAYYAVGQIASATANIPLDRAIGKANHVRLAFAQETKFWQSVSLLLGFSEWDLNMIEKDKKKTKFGKKMKWKKRKLKKRKLK